MIYILSCLLLSVQATIDQISLYRLSERIATAMIESTSVCRCQGNGHCRVIDGLDSRQPYVLRLEQEGAGTLLDHWPPKYFPRSLQ